MTFDREPCTVGIAALEPREKHILPNIKKRHFTAFHAFSRLNW
jgi:hypothetical protein